MHIIIKLRHSVYYYIKSHNSFHKISIVALFFVIRAKIIRKYDKTFSTLHINFKTNNHTGFMGMLLKRAINFDRDPSTVQAISRVTFKFKM